MFAVITLLFTACFSDSIKDKLNDSMIEMQTNLADQTFRKTLGDIELHKLRFGQYPKSLSEIKFLNSFDSANFHSVQYHLLDSGYELNLKARGRNVDGQKLQIDLEYPEEFWQGLGCVKSNLRKANAQ